jgi:hypothetical protein
MNLLSARRVSRPRGGLDRPIPAAGDTGREDVICAFLTRAVWKVFVADRLEQLHRECEKFGESGLVALTT